MQHGALHKGGEGCDGLCDVKQEPDEVPSTSENEVKTEPEESKPGVSNPSSMLRTDGFIRLEGSGERQTYEPKQEPYYSDGDDCMVVGMNLPRVKVTHCSVATLYYLIETEREDSRQ